MARRRLPRKQMITGKSAKETRAVFAQALGRARTIIYVHGIGNKPTPSVLKCQWDHALFGFDLGERSRLAYWVNRDYYPEPSPGTCQTGDLVELEEERAGTSAAILKNLSTVTLEDEVATLTFDKAAQRVLLKIARTVEERPPKLTEAQIQARAIEAKLLPLPPILRKWITRKLTRALLRDVNDYFFVPKRREVMRESVLERLRAAGGPFIVIGHSQGSMIGYDVLSSLPKSKHDIVLFLTIGSPLGLAEVQDVLKDLTGQNRLAVPSCVSRWVNVADPLDPVALDKGLSNDFRPTGKIEDAMEWNPDSPRHPHSGSGYLRTRAVQMSVREEVETGLFQRVADFVIARDVSRDLENAAAAARHKVLIELVDPARTDGATLDQMRRTVITELKESTKAPEESLRIEPLRHFVAADLTREEIEALAAKTTLRIRRIRRIWRNAQKHALLEVSINTVQARPAHVGYQALGRGITWAVLDTGIAERHPHFQKYKNVVTQFDCTKPGPLGGGQALDEHGHGTHVAGIIAGYHEIKTPGTRPRVLAGMAPETQLYIYKVLDKRGSGEDAWIIKALDHIAETNERAGSLVVQGLNLSLGGSFDQSVYGCGHSPLCVELRRLWRQGVLVVIAAGNEGFVVLQTLEGTMDANMDLSIGDPANLEEAIAVGSIHKENPHTYGVSYFSSRGPTADGRQKPDLVAPGERIFSCRHRWPRGARRVNELYVEMSGTSMAAPHVSGLLAGFLSIRREFIGYPDRVKAILLENCTSLRLDRPQQGAGMPNLVKMLVTT